MIHLFIYIRVYKINDNVDVIHHQTPFVKKSKWTDGPYKKSKVHVFSVFKKVYSSVQRL